MIEEERRELPRRNGISTSDDEEYLKRKQNQLENDTKKAMLKQQQKELMRERTRYINKNYKYFKK